MVKSPRSIIARSSTRGQKKRLSLDQQAAKPEIRDDKSEFENVGSTEGMRDSR